MNSSILVPTAGGSSKIVELIRSSAVFAIMVGACGGKERGKSDLSDLRDVSDGGALASEAFASEPSRLGGCLEGCPGGAFPYAHSVAPPSVVDPQPPAWEEDAAATVVSASAQGGCPVRSLAPPPEGGVLRDASSMRYVAFHVTNDGPNDVFVAGLGRGCAPFSIAYSDGCPIQDGPGSCAMISNWNYVDTYDRLPPGGEMETNWFGTEWIPYSSSSCTPYGVSVIASPGTYRATFGFERAIPPGCSNADTGNLWYCATGGSVVSGQQFNAQCRTSESVTAEFVLPPPSSTDVGEGGNQAVATVEVHIR